MCSYKIKVTAFIPTEGEIYIHVFDLKQQHTDRSAYDIKYRESDSNAHGASALLILGLL